MSYTNPVGSMGGVGNASSDSGGNSLNQTILAAASNPATFKNSTNLLGVCNALTPMILNQDAQQSLATLQSGGTLPTGQTSTGQTSTGQNSQVQNLVAALQELEQNQSTTTA